MLQAGATYNVPFPVIVRSIFGMYGSFPAICIRGEFVQITCTRTLLTTRQLSLH